MTLETGWSLLNPFYRNRLYWMATAQWEKVYYFFVSISTKRPNLSQATVCTCYSKVNIPWLRSVLQHFQCYIIGAGGHRRQGLNQTRPPPRARHSRRSSAHLLHIIHISTPLICRMFNFIPGILDNDMVYPQTRLSYPLWCDQALPSVTPLDGSGYSGDTKSKHNLTRRNPFNLSLHFLGLSSQLAGFALYSVKESSFDPTHKRRQRRSLVRNTKFLCLPNAPNSISWRSTKMHV